MTLQSLSPPFAGDRNERRRRPRRETVASTPFVRVSMGMMNRMVGAVDASIILGVALVFHYLDIAGPPPLSIWQTAIAGVVGAVTFASALGLWSGYRVERYRRFRGQAIDVIVGVALAALANRAVVWAFEPEVLTAHLWLSLWLAAVLIGLASGRLACAMVVDILWTRGLLRRRVAVVGATLMAGDLIRRIRREEWHRDLELVGLFDDVAPGVAGTVEDLRRLAQTRRVDLIVLALPWSRSADIFHLGDRLQWISADVVTPLEQPGFLSRSNALTQIAGIPALQLTRHPFRGTQGLVKQAQDYVVAACAIVLTAPILAMAATALALSGGGPVLFRQDRIGFNGRPFSIYKLRTMTVDLTDDGAGGQIRGNPRITKIGALLRRTSIDELPQLLNVLKGEMSIVGPRPHVAGMRIGSDPYAEAVRTYAARHQIKPGITGWAQINGMRGGIDTLEKAQRGVELDLDYMRNWSLQLDLSIMVRTVTRHLMGPEVF
ncbi:exopolysaccharide biosynthesis polyprenyl glycosylphosphotransferase [Brevundimonas sp. NIBR11]|uniref:exopolysaccharide biosynthesis polyprenyl glycosylphosphotransferase n=1 Tax=Brevundimonas sp. NIBR11 TaxID=3015999 RepID=UPI0022F12179|nr:exopolysaccharide biosynthesis polyprenyl glycosylphosphotransferase [Brevundimonas sp. NIBR11]